MLKLHDLQPAPGSTKRRKRVGRGVAAGGGKTAGRGTKGQHARRQVKPGFEGGQTPLQRRMPKLRGFVNPFRVEYHVINLDTIQRFAEANGSVVTPDTLRAVSLVPKHGLVKVLGRGELRAAVQVSAHGFSQSAVAAIEAAGGSVTRLPLPFGVRPAAKGNALTNR
jgi:large subunit ribosomal protein L15